MPAPDLVVAVVAAAVTAPLRRQVLRPGHPLPLPGDDDPTAVHVAARDGPSVVAAANVRPEPPSPGSGLAADGAWRLRGMAASPTGTGAGAVVLAAATEQVRARGGRLLWCHARVAAQAFYEREGLVARGRPWDDDEIGPHVLMWRRLDG